MLLCERQPLGFLEGRCHVGFKKNNNKLLGVRGGQTVIEEEELGRFGLFPMCSVMSYIKVSLVAELWDF